MESDRNGGGAATYDDDALWGLYDIIDEGDVRRRSFRDGRSSFQEDGIVRLSDRSFVAGEDVDVDDDHYDDDDRCADGTFAARTVLIRPGLSVVINVPLGLMEYGCVGEVGGGCKGVPLKCSPLRGRAVVGTDWV